MFIMNTGRFIENYFWLVIMVGLVGLIVPKGAFCHRVTVFAWVEGDMVHTESKVGGGKVLKDAIIDVYDDAGGLLLQGKTDATGQFSFQAPQKADLKVVLKGEMGHRAEWLVRKEEFGVPLASGVDLPTQQAGKENQKEETIRETILSPRFSADHKIFEKMLDQKLAPLAQQIGELRQQANEPKMKDVFGGIGYILGLIGVAAYVRSRKK